MRIRAAAFDLDGTLVDTSADIAASVNAARLALDRPPVAAAEAVRHVGDGVDALIRRIVCERAEDFERARQLYLDHQGQHFRDHATLYPGVAEGLERLAADGVQLSVVSNKADRFAGPLLRHLGIADRFTHILGDGAGVKKKPAPDGLLLVLREQGVVPADALMVGDSWQDIAAGRAAGCTTVWCRYGFGDLDGWQADFTADAFEDVLAVVRGCHRAGRPHASA